MFQRLGDLLARFRDPAIRALWTFLYVFVGTLAVSLSSLGDTLDLSVGKAALVAALLAGVKTVVALRFGDPLAIKTNLSDFAVRLIHTAWQGLVAVFIAGGLHFDKATIVATLIAVILNAIKATALPALPQPDPTDPGTQDPTGDVPVDPGTDVPLVDPLLDPTVDPLLDVPVDPATDVQPEPATGSQD
jgi:hypothetical protein